MKSFQYCFKFSKCLCSSNIAKSGGHLSCGVNLYGVCTNVIFKFAFHFQFLVLVCVQQFCVFYISTIWAIKDQCLHLCFNLVNPLEVIVFYIKYFCKFIDRLRFVSKATL